MLSQVYNCDFYPIEPTYPKSRSTKDAFARVLLGRSGGGSRWAQRYTSARGRLGHRPVRRVSGLRGARCTGAGEGPPVCIRWFQEARPEPSWAKSPAKCRGGAPKGERARSVRPELHFEDPASVLPVVEDRSKGARRIAFRCGSRARLLALRLPSSLGEDFLATLSLAWLLLAWVKLGCEAHRENEKTRHHRASVW